MKVTVGLAQVDRPTHDDVLAQVRSMMEEARERGVQLLVFPECLMTPWQKTAAEYRETAEPLDGPFGQAMSALAQEFGLTVVYTANEFRDEGKNPYNTAVVVDEQGKCLGSYRKVHLFDSVVTRESDRMSSGCRLFDPVDTACGRLGLGICFDLRFADVARWAAENDAQIMVYPAAWYDGPDKLDQWITLLRARAIENEFFVIGACRADERCVGHSCIVDPLGHVVAEAGVGEKLLVATIDLEDIIPVRQAIPVL